MYPITISPKITDLEADRLSEAYSALKDKHMELKRAHRLIKEQNRILRMELLDYKERYDHLIKYINQNDL